MLKKILFSSGILTLTLKSALAVTTEGDNLQLSNPLGTNNLEQVLSNIVPKLILIAAPIVTIMVLYGAFLMLTSAGNEEKILAGRKTILYAAIGFLVVLLAGSVVPVIRSIFK